MDFTREPIIETVITPKEGCKLVVRSSKNAGQEEYFVDAVEVVSFGNALFFRSIERPKAFLAPASDYEVLEVREARMVLKNVGIDRTIKIGGGKEPAEKRVKEPVIQEPSMVSAEVAPQQLPEAAESIDSKLGRLDKRRDKRRHSRRRRGREEGVTEGLPTEEKEVSYQEEPIPATTGAEKNGTVGMATPPPFSSLLPPPPTLISETIARYRDNAMFKDAFFVRDEEESNLEPFDSIEAPERAEGHSDDLLEALEMQKMTLEPSAYGSLDSMEEERVDFEPEKNSVDIPHDDNERSDFPL